ncbi:Dps family protein [Aquimarina algicola]|uniref:DNA starvation/stationary phase protection protein n=1 Tax=Aquimarina algicola TaxID=2589995 RepID=A0A504J0W6_9FLAO|nr:DNA starvation/stationary phase protection protein [Aquimarina algicola]TPN84476.1 DNA starvation/stationary phase protection protein [Aquimarina algicola]
MKQQTKHQKEYKKLGFTYLDTAEILVTLNQLLSNYTIHYHKLYSFQWNVEGNNFFELQKQFNIECDQVKLQIDSITERIRVFGVKPKNTLKQHIEFSKIKEVQLDISSISMVEEIISDFQILHNSLLDVINAALDTGDSATEELAVSIIKRLEKRNWMFTSWIN